jgi:methylenetetrahydrofolate dehydrogenase (NADP+)/methenyltetrahydrofolate cyclohydrolase
MAAKLLEGKVLAEKIKADLKQQVDALKSKSGKSPKLVAIQVGENPASEIYIKSQKKNSEGIGIGYELRLLDRNSSESDLVRTIEMLNRDDTITGVILQMPLPAGIDSKKMTGFISPNKDAEAMNPANAGKVIFGNAPIAPCTAAGVMELIKSTNVDLYGKEAVVVGHSEIVGKPVALLLLDKFATTTVCHIGTGQRGTLADHVRRAEVLVVAVGKAGIVKGDWIKEGAIVVDVGINRIGDRIVGDVEFEVASQRAAYITPVPGGVGPLTVTMLMRNVVEAFRLQS